MFSNGILLKYEKLKAIRVNWKQQAEKIELEYKKAEVKAAGQGVAGIGAGVALAAFGPTAAMGIATTFGVASTGTAILLPPKKLGKRNRL